MEQAAPGERDWMLTPEQRIRAHLNYLQKPAREFLPLLFALAILLLAGGLAFRTLYHQESLTFARALYITWALVFNEHLLPFPGSWLLRAFYVVVPPLGLFVILDGIFRFSYHLLRRDAASREWNVAMNQTLRDHVILIGLGNVGFRTLQTLLQLGESVAVMEKDEACPNIAYARNHGVPVIVGSGREEGMLSQLGIEHAKSLICASDDDLANLEIAIDARTARPGIRVVLRMFDQELAAKVKNNFDIHQAFSTSALAAPLFATASSDRSIDSAFRVGKRLMVVAHLDVQGDSKLKDRTLGELTRDHALHVLALNRDGQEHFHPPGDLRLGAGDQIVLQAEPSVLTALQRLNGEG